VVTLGTANEVWARRVKEARLAAGLSQKELGIKAGLDPFVASTRINRYEVGVHKADFLISQRLAAILRIPVAYLYCSEDDLAVALIALHRLPPAKRRKAIKMLAETSPPDA